MINLSGKIFHSGDELLEVDISKLMLDELVALRNHLYNNQFEFAHDANMHYVWGKVEKQLKMGEPASVCFKNVIKIDPNHIEAIRELGFLMAESGDLQKAMEYFSLLVAKEPTDWAGWNDGGCSLRAMGDTNGAIKWMKEACEKNPTSPTLFANVATLEYEIHNFNECQNYLDKAFELDQSNPEALHTQAMLYSSIGEHQKALEYEERTLDVKPEYPHAKLGLGLAHLTLGNLKEGFVGYEHRWNGSDKSDTKIMLTLNKPHWYGQEVYKQSTIAVMPEQGFGDMVQFAQLIPMLLEKFYRVYWFVPVEMYRLAYNSFASDRIIINHDISAVEHRKIDYETQIMSLGLALNLELKTIPATHAYMKSDEKLVTNIGESKLQSIKGLKVGLAWTGKPTLGKQKLRSIEPSLLSMLDDPSISFFSLQKNAPAPLEMQNVYDYMDECNDFMDTASLISNLDLVISVDTVIAHLAAALGKPTWLLNRLGSEWRWMDAKESSPWYPTMKIFNQKKLGEWEGVINNVKQELMYLKVSKEKQPRNNR